MRPTLAMIIRLWSLLGIAKGLLPHCHDPTGVPVAHSKASLRGLKSPRSEPKPARILRSTLHLINPEWRTIIIGKLQTGKPRETETLGIRDSVKKKYPPPGQKINVSCGNLPIISRFCETPHSAQDKPPIFRLRFAALDWWCTEPAALRLKTLRPSEVVSAVSMRVRKASPLRKSGIARAMSRMRATTPPRMIRGDGGGVPSNLSGRAQSPASEE